jgi:hypothetical protein
VIVKGSIECTPGEKYEVRATVVQNGDSGGGVDTGACTNAAKEWTVTTKPDSPEPGPAQVTADGRSFLGGAQHGPTVTTTRTVELRG